jgi:hypothetical protein
MTNPREEMDEEQGDVSKDMKAQEEKIMFEAELER